MSSGEDPPRGQSPHPRRGRSPNNPGRGSGPGGTNVIEFIDSQDPNVKSTIQRHTAFHSAAQRREARLQSLRRGSQSRYLEWGRRPGKDQPPTTSPGSSGSSLSVSPAPSISGRDRSAPPPLESAELAVPQSSGFPSISSTPSRDSAVLPLSLRQSEEAILQFYLSALCQCTSSSERYETVIAFMRSDEACVYLLLSYCCALRAKQLANPDAEQDRQSAQSYFGRGTNILWNRLRDRDNASSDFNIQAVLLLVSYTSDFGQTTGEVEMHAEALRTMVAQRGGVASMVDNTALHLQLTTIETSRWQHLTLDCGPSCQAPLRFPDGFWKNPQGEST